MEFLSENEHPEGEALLQPSEHFEGKSFLLQNVQADDQCAHIPDGLKELMTDISREVLRDQPENIYEFVAEYLEELLMEREHRTITENLLDKVIDDSVTICQLIQSCGVDKERAKMSAQIMNKSFTDYVEKKSKLESVLERSLSNQEQSLIVEKDVCRKILETCDLPPKQESHLRKIVQTCFKKFYFREKTYKLKLIRLPDAHWTNRAEKTLDIYRKTAPERWKMERAATVIQAVFRGYMVRKGPRELRKFNECAMKIQLTFRGFSAKKKANKAATKIQSAYRGYKERERLRKRIKCLQTIQRRSKYVCLIRSIVRMLINEAMGVMEFEPDSETYTFLSEIVDNLLISALPITMKEVVDTTSRVLVDNVIHSAVKSVLQPNTFSILDLAATDIQRTYRGYIVRRDLQRTIDSILKIQNVSGKDKGVTEAKAIDLGIYDILSSLQDDIHERFSGKCG